MAIFFSGGWNSDRIFAIFMVKFLSHCVAFIKCMFFLPDPTVKIEFNKNETAPSKFPTLCMVFVLTHSMHNVFVVRRQLHEVMLETSEKIRRDHF